MTANTIAYGNLLESQRHNLEVERTNWFSAEETAKHNRENEAIGWFNGQEAARHNLQNERISWANLAELNRSNVAKEWETFRHDTTVEAQTKRNDAAMRSIERLNSQRNMFTNLFNTIYTNNTQRQIAEHRDLTALNTTAMQTTASKEIASDQNINRTINTVISSGSNIISSFMKSVN